MTQMTVPDTSGGKNRNSIENGLAISRPNTPAQSSAPYTAPSPYFWAMMIIGLSTVNVAPATTGRRTPRIFPMPTLWIRVATPDTSRSALTSSPMVEVGSFSVPPTMSGTATAPAYMMNRCCRPRTNSRGAGSTSSTGWTLRWPGGLGGGASVVLDSDMSPPGAVALVDGGSVPSVSYFRIVKYDFRITDKLNSSSRTVKGSAAGDTRTLGVSDDGRRNTASPEAAEDSVTSESSETSETSETAATDGADAADGASAADGADGADGADAVTTSGAAGAGLAVFNVLPEDQARDAL